MRFSKIIYSKAFTFIPPLLFAIVICLINKTFLYLFLYLPIVFIWILITLPLIKVEDYLLRKENSNKLQISLTNEIIKYFNISEVTWKNYSQEKKSEIADFYFTYIRNTRLHYEVSSQIPKDWHNFSIDDKMSTMKEYFELNIFYSNYLAIQKSKQEEKDKIEKDKKIIREEEKRIRDIELEKKKAEVQKVKDDLDKEIELKKRKEKEDCEREEIIRNKKIEEELRYKNKIKKDILRKENEKKLSSDAVKELIEEGLLPDNYNNTFERLSIPINIREVVWKRDKECCVICHSNTNLELDHIIPISKGGSNTINNLQVLCRTCNRKKSNKIE